VQGLVRSIEFRGPIYRVRMCLPDGNGGLEFDADIQAGLLERKSITEGMMVPLLLPPERLLAFHPGAHS
jgi:hypothetical protein